MNKSISLTQYRVIDLGLMTLLMLVSQGIISLVSTTVYADQLYTVSTVAIVAGLVYMRWNFWGAIPAALGGFWFSLLTGGSFQQHCIYILGNLFSLLALGLFRWPGKDRICGDGLQTIFFAIAVQVSMQLGRAAVAFSLGTPLATCLGFITTDALNILFTLVVLWIARRVPGLFEDQINYLRRLREECRKDRSDPF